MRYTRFVQCEANGITYEQYLDGPHVPDLNCFMGGVEFDTLEFMQAFPATRTLSIIKQVSSLFNLLVLVVGMQDKIRCIAGLQCCSRLGSLWISECRLEHIGGLQFCTQLVNLHLSSNNICHINGLSYLTALQVYSLSALWGRLEEIRL